MFVSVTLLVEVASEAVAEAMEAPEDLLTKVADLMGRDFTGECVLELEEHAWEVVDVEVTQQANKPQGASRSPRM